ncbi:YceD family protein [Labedella populi]
MTGLQKTPYTIGVRDLINRPGEMREHSYDFDVPARLGEGLVAVREGVPMHAEIRLESVHEGILVTAEVDTTADGECGRCLREISQPVEVEIQELFAYAGSEASEYEVLYDHVDLESLVRDAVVLSLPFQPVCTPDCPGLDPETGERLERRPEPESREASDPRWAALAGFAPRPGSGTSDAADKEEG